jgi:hypothetical protein
MVDWDLAKIVQLSAVCSSSYWLWPMDVLVVNHIPAVMHTHTWVPWMKVAENHKSFGHVWGQTHMHLDQLYYIHIVTLYCCRFIYIVPNDATSKPAIRGHLKCAKNNRASMGHGIS